MTAMRGVLSWGVALPYRRLERATIAPVVGQGGGTGRRTVASFDEDPATLAVAAGRAALRSAPGVTPDVLLFGSTAPAYADKTNATVVHAALRLPRSTGAFDLGLSARSVMGGLLLAGQGTGTIVVAAGDIRTGLAGSVEESGGGDAGAAVIIGESTSDTAVLAEIIGSASVTREFVDRWRTPGDVRTKVWDDRFAEVTYAPLGLAAWHEALSCAGLDAGQVAAAAIAAPTPRIATTVGARLGGVPLVDDLGATVGQCGAAQPALLLAALLEQAAPSEVLVLLSLADGADALVVRTTAALATHRPAVRLAEQLATGAPIPYGKFLAWRGMLDVEPPRRPEPPRVSATAAARSEAWKFGFVGSRDRTTGAVHLPPLRVSADGSRTDEMDEAPMADVEATIATFTIDRLAYSPSPPIVFAVVDFDGGGRLPVELTDCDADEVHVGLRVEMTFRRLYTADGIPDYFWKARPIRRAVTEAP
jgi:3-hydroxy-3-methylglutaryl CoA synthase